MEYAPYTINDIINVAKNKRHFKSLWGKDLRYQNLNLHALHKFGSLEVRCLDGNATPGRLNFWTHSLVHTLSNAATRFADPRQLLQTYNNVGPEQFLQALMPNHLVERWIKLIPNFEELIDQNYSFLLLIATSTDDWANEEDPDPRQLVSKAKSKTAKAFQRDVEEDRYLLQLEAEELLEDVVDDAEDAEMEGARRFDVEGIRVGIDDRRYANVNHEGDWVLRDYDVEVEAYFEPQPPRNENEE
jgi:hypothetical protein